MVEKFKEKSAFISIAYAELWDRFSYYGLQSLFILYLTKYFQLADSASYSLYGAYTALTFAFTLLGGIIADKFLGLYYATLLGGLLIAIGNLVLTLHGLDNAYLGFAVIIVGIGLFKPNNPNLLGSLYKEAESNKRIKAFSVFYVFINVGSLLGPLLYGITTSFQYYWIGFAFTALGMLSAITFLYTFRNKLRDAFIEQNFQFFIKGIVLLIICISLCYLLLIKYTIFGKVLLGVVIAAIVFFIIFLKKLPVQERNSILLLIVPIISCIIFLASLLQIYSSLTLFIERYVNRNIGGWNIPTTWFSSLEPLFIIVLVPLLSFVWSLLAKRKTEPMAENKVMIGLLFAAASFFIFAMSAHFSTTSQCITLLSIVIANAFLAVGELCIIPVTMSLTNLRAPLKYQGTLMGIFYFSLTISGYCSSLIAKFTLNASQSTNISSIAYSFNHIAVFLILAAVALYFIQYIYKNKL